MSQSSSRTAEDRIKEETAIPQEVRSILGRSPKQDTRPLQLTRWTHEFVEASRTSGISDKKTRRWIRAYARDAFWSEAQIDAVLHDNELI